MDVMRIGVMLLTLGNGLYINLSAVSPIGKIIAFEIVAAAGAGFLFQPPLIALQAHVGPKQTASATATLGLVRNLATSLSIVASGVAFANGMDKQSHILLKSGLASNLTASFSGSGAAAHVMLVRTIDDPTQQFAVKEAYASSLRSIWILCTCMASCAVIACAFVMKKELSKVHVEHRTGLEKTEPEAGVVSS